MSTKVWMIISQLFIHLRMTYRNPIPYPWSFAINLEYKNKSYDYQIPKISIQCQKYPSSYPIPHGKASLARTIRNPFSVSVGYTYLTNWSVLTQFTTLVRDLILYLLFVPSLHIPTLLSISSVCYNKLGVLAMPWIDNPILSSVHLEFSLCQVIKTSKYSKYAHLPM